MNRIAVESSTLATVAYDNARQRLQLEFHSRAIYQYHGVPPVVYEGLLGVFSKGGYFNRAIRGRFPHSLVAKGSAAVPEVGLLACRR